MMQPTQGRMAGFTPRQRQEIEAPRLLQSRQEIPLVRAQTTFATILTARADAYFQIEGLWTANTTAVDHDYSVCLVAPSGSPTVANALVWAFVVPASTVDYAVGVAGMLVPPGYTVQVNSDTNDTINVYGWGWNIIGDSQ